MVFSFLSHFVGFFFLVAGARGIFACGWCLVFAAIVVAILDVVVRFMFIAVTFDDTSGGSRIFPRGGREPSRGGVNPPGGAWTRQIFPKTAWNRKNLDAQGGGRASLTPPPRSANGHTLNHYWQAPHSTENPGSVTRLLTFFTKIFILIGPWHYNRIIG